MQTPVTIGQQHGDLVVIENGLAAGDQVVTTGQMMLQPGAPIMVIPSGPPPADAAGGPEGRAGHAQVAAEPGPAQGRAAGAMAHVNGEATLVNLSEPFIRRPVMTVLLTAVRRSRPASLAYHQMPFSDLPAVDYPVIQVQVAYPGATPDTMANNVATPLERQFLQIPGLELVTSNSGQGNTSFTLQFALDKSIDAAATDVQAAITRAQGQLPQDLPSPPTFTKTNPNDQPQAYLAVMSNTLTEAQLYDYGSTQVGQRISILKGVSQVQEFGTPSAVRIKADPGKLAVRGLTIDDLDKAIRANTAYQGAGQFDGPSRTLLLQPQGQLGTAAGYNDMIVGQFKGSPVHLRDVARAIDGVQDERQHPSFWFRHYQVPDPDHPGKTIEKSGAPRRPSSSSPSSGPPGRTPSRCQGGDPRRAAQDQEDAPAQRRPAPDLRRAASIRDSIVDVQETLVIAFILVVLVIFVFLGRAADTLIPAVALPLSLLLTFVVMNVLGYSLDNLSLMALTLAIGFLVDDAIVFLENAVRRMEKFGETPLVASPPRGPGDQLHHPEHDRLAGGGVHPARVPVRADGPHLPRVQPDDRDRHLRQRHRVAER